MSGYKRGRRLLVSSVEAGALYKTLLKTMHVELTAKMISIKRVKSIIFRDHSDKEIEWKSEAEPVRTREAEK